MLALSYKRFCELIPKDTLKFVKLALNFMDDLGRLVINGDVIKNTRDIALFHAFFSYMSASEENNNLLRLYGYKIDKDFMRYQEMNERQEKEVFSKCYEYFTPFNKEEDYVLLTPEDIILNMHDIITKEGKSYNNRLFKKIDGTSIYEALRNVSTEKKQILKQSCESNITKKTNKELLGLYETAAAIFDYLIINRNSYDGRFSLNDSGIVSLSLLIAILSKEPSDEEERMIIDYCNSHGLTLDVIRNMINLRLNIYDENYNNIYIHLTSNFKDIINNYNDSKIEDLFKALINGKINDSFIIKKALSTCNLTPEDFDELFVQIKEFRKNEEIEKKERITNGLLPQEAECLETIASYYQYLLEEYRNDRIDKSIVDDEEDLIALSVLITSYNYNTNISQMFEYEGITINKIVELINNDFRNIELTPAPNSIIYLFNNYITIANCQKNKIDIKVKDILYNLFEPLVEKSDVINRIFKTVKGEDIGNAFERIDRVKKKINETQMKELEEELLRGLSADVYNFLPIIISYCVPFLKKNKQNYDKDTVVASAIICAASRYNHNIGKYLEDNGFDRKRLVDIFNKDFSYEDYEIDIKFINKYLKKFIYDRDNKDITIYSILDNAIKQNDSFDFDKVLFRLGINKDVFMDVEKKSEEYRIQTEKRQMEEKKVSLFVDCGSILNIIQYTLRIHKYLETKIKDNILYRSLIEDDNDIEELSLLISLLVNDNGTYNPYFEHNGITIDVIMDIFNLSEEELNKVKEFPLDENIILKYEKYIKNDYMDVNLLVRRLFDSTINSSSVIEKITEYTGNQYEYLKEEAINKQMRKLTPEQGLDVLTKEIVPILTSDSIVDVASYGDELSKHSSLISDALHELTYANSIEHSVSDINELCDEVFIEPKKTKGLFALFFKKKEVQIDHKTNVIDEIKESISNNLNILYDELNGYEYIKKYIETYLIKLNDYLIKLKEYRSLLEENIERLKNSQGDDVQAYTEYLNFLSLKDIVDNKISTFETTIALMSQELVKVHRAIVTHFSTINALNTSNSAILPILASELALNAGTKSESNALSVSKNLVDLLQNVVNQNVIETRETLAKLSSLSSMDPIRLEAVNHGVDSYLQTIDTKEETNDSETNEVVKLLLNKKQ